MLDEVANRAQDRRDRRQKLGFLMTGRYPRDGPSVIGLGPATRLSRWQRLVTTRDADCAGCRHLIEKGTFAEFRVGERGAFQTGTALPALYHLACRKVRNRHGKATKPTPAHAGQRTKAEDALLTALIAKDGNVEWRSVAAGAAETHLSRKALLAALGKLQEAARLTWTQLPSGVLVVALRDATSEPQSPTHRVDQWASA